MWRTFFLILNFIFYCDSSWIKDLNLPRQLLEYHISSNPKFRQKCIEDEKCSINVRFPIISVKYNFKSFSLTLPGALALSQTVIKLIL